MDLHAKIKNRKTVDLSILRTYVVDKINEMAEYNLNCPGLNTLQSDLSYYKGYQHRTWLVFTSFPAWLDIVHALQAYDDENQTRHYWGLLDGMERIASDAKFYYGGSLPFVPTGKEIKRVTRFYNRYLTILGLD